MGMGGFIRIVGEEIEVWEGRREVVGLEGF